MRSTLGPRPSGLYVLNVSRFPVLLNKCKKILSGLIPLRLLRKTDNIFAVVKSKKADLKDGTPLAAMVLRETKDSGKILGLKVVRPGQGH